MRGLTCRSPDRRLRRDSWCAAYDLYLLSLEGARRRIDHEAVGGFQARDHLNVLAQIQPELDVLQMHAAIRIDDRQLHALVAEQQRLFGHDKHAPVSRHYKLNRRIGAWPEQMIRVLSYQFRDDGSRLRVERVCGRQ